jgi:hypothetical protein
MHVARALCEACSDCCESFELWAGIRHVDRSFREELSLTADALKTRIDTLEREIAIRDSEWTIAEGQRLLEESSRLFDRTHSRVS